jgi:hypothetical protein
MNQIPPQQAYYLPSPKTNGNAIASMVLGIVSWILYIGLWCFNATFGTLMTIATYGIGLLCLLPLSCISPLLWLIGVITGHLGSSQIKRTGEGGQGLAVTGLILNYLGLGLIVGGTIVILILVVTGVISAGALGTLIPLYEYNY